MWKIAQNILTTIVMFISGFLYGLFAIPSVLICFYVLEYSEYSTIINKSILFSLSLGFGYFFWMFNTIFGIGIISFILKPNFKLMEIPFFSITSFRWAFLSVLDRLAKPFISKMAPSWIVDVYYKLLGCKMGKGAIVASSRINDVFMVKIGSGSIIGSKASITAHIAEKNFLVLAPVTIGKNCLIGLGSQINPGCKIGDNSVIASRSVLPKYTVVPPREIWGGIPAKFIKEVT